MVNITHTCRRLRSFLLKVLKAFGSNGILFSAVMGLNLIVTCLNLYTLGNTSNDKENALYKHSKTFKSIETKIS